MLQDRAAGQENRGHNAVLRGFLKAQPKSLGTFQIIIGVVIFLIGIVLTADRSFIPLTVFSGVTFWGSLIYISAGTLSVVAANKLHSCVVKASLGMNVVSAITAGIATILMSLNIILLSHGPCRNYSNTYKEFCFDEVLENGILGILLVFSISQMIISICISAFACKATCDFSLVDV